MFICQAFGIPAIGVGQPADACIAAKSAYSEIEPQPGSAWKVPQGRGWEVSRLDGTSGPVFLETTTAAVEVKLDKGPQCFSISAPMERGISIRWFELKAK